MRQQNGMERVRVACIVACAKSIADVITVAYKHVSIALSSLFRQLLQSNFSDKVIQTTGCCNGLKSVHVENGRVAAACATDMMLSCYSGTGCFCTNIFDLDPYTRDASCASTTWIATCSLKWQDSSRHLAAQLFSWRLLLTFRHVNITRVTRLLLWNSIVQSLATEAGTIY